MTVKRFCFDETDVAREIDHVKGLIRSHQENLEVLEQIIARQGVANVDLHFRKAALEDDLAASWNRLRDLEARMKGLSITNSLQVITEILYTHLPSGVLDLYDPATMPLLEYGIFNNTGKSVTFVLMSEIEDFSFSRSDTVNIAPNTERIVYQLPRLKTDKAKVLTDIRRAVVHTCVKYLEDGREHLLQQQDSDIYLMARNVIRWAIPDVVKGSGYKPLLEHIAAWVTPRAEPVKQMLREAVEYNPKHAMWGYQGAPNPQTARIQVKAIYQALKLVGKLAYVNSPFAIGSKNGEVRQAVRLPTESLSERSANCIDGAVLYASLMELAALEPLVVIKTGHAFVGWKTWQGANDYEFIETTMTLTEPFEKSFKRGMEEYLDLRDTGWFEREVFDSGGFARLLDIKALHDAGIYPME
ncbi:MAG: hypothetical protein SXV54_09315 [Chloroflexota bacterium]|nr:hypothetical protein [Chloroflexota bacterium]